MFSEMDMPLSLRTTMNLSGLRWTMLFSASKLEPRSSPVAYDGDGPRVEVAVGGGLRDAEGEWRGRCRRARRRGVVRLSLGSPNPKVRPRAGCSGSRRVGP